MLAPRSSCGPMPLASLARRAGVAESAFLRMCMTRTRAGGRGRRFEAEANGVRPEANGITTAPEIPVLRDHQEVQKHEHGQEPGITKVEGVEAGVLRGGLPKHFHRRRSNSTMKSANHWNGSWKLPRRS